MNEDRGDSTEEVGVVEAGRGRSEVERSSRSESGSWFQRLGKAYRKERKVIRREADGCGQVSDKR